MKLKIIRWLVSLLNNEYMVVNRERVNHLAMSANQMPQSKILTLSLLRLDGITTLKEALEIYDQWNKAQ